MGCAIHFDLCVLCDMQSAPDSERGAILMTSACIFFAASFTRDSSQQVLPVIRGCRTLLLTVRRQHWKSYHQLPVLKRLWHRHSHYRRAIGIQNMFDHRVHRHSHVVLLSDMKLLPQLGRLSAEANVLWVVDE